MDIDRTVTVLRDAEGTAQHAILPWSEFEALRRAADGGAPPKQSQLPASIRAAVSEGSHPVRAWREHRQFNQAQLAAGSWIRRAPLPTPAEPRSTERESRAPS